MHKYMINLVSVSKEKKITQQEIAIHLGISQQKWSDYEGGRNELPMRYFIQVCKFLETSADKILEINNPQTPA